MKTLKRSTYSKRPSDARLHLPVLQAPPELATDSSPVPRRRLPVWIKAKLPTGDTYFDVRRLVHEERLHTVCESASCPNIGECWNRRALTIMILGGICTRSCQFCDVPTGKPEPVDADEPRRVGETLAKLGLSHTVITSVDRDDLPDGGAAHWAATIRAVKAASPTMTLEVLTGDFKGSTRDLDVVLDAAPDVFAHNLETVPRLSQRVRVQASYARSYSILSHAHARGAVTKTGLMLGLGETLDEVRAVVRELAALGVDIVTLGQYLQPSRTHHLPVVDFLEPAVFDALAAEARALGIAHVEAGPLVRSSYHADGQAALVRAVVAGRAATLLG